MRRWDKRKRGKIDLRLCVVHGWGHVRGYRVVVSTEWGRSMGLSEHVVNGRGRVHVSRWGGNDRFCFFFFQKSRKPKNNERKWGRPQGLEHQTLSCWEENARVTLNRSGLLFTMEPCSVGMTKYRWSAP